jgi:hypothetical protein
MNAIPVTSPATVIETLQAGATDPLSKKKNAVAARQPIETIQNDIPTKSLVAKIAVAALAELVIPKMATASNAILLNLLMKTSCVVCFLLSLYINCLRLNFLKQLDGTYKKNRFV